MADAADELDRALLRELIADPRLPVVELARRLDVARGTVQTRLERLTRRGMIAGFVVDVAQLGYPITAFVQLQIRQGQGVEVRERLAAFPEVLEIHTTAGAFDMICRVAARSSAELQELIDRLVDHPTIVRSTTSIVLSSPVAYRVDPLLG